MSVTSSNTALSASSHAPRSVAEGNIEAISTDNPARLSLAPRFAALHLSLSGSLMLERYKKSLKH